MRDYFDVSYSRRDFYRVLNNFSVWKDDALKRTISVAKKHFGFSFSFVFYDLTTLYFESFETDDLRKVGFSKDNKSANPQIMIGLMVDDNGFPVYYQVFPGNKFEGHTLMPSLEC
jgi:transposase